MQKSYVPLFPAKQVDTVCKVSSHSQTHCLSSVTDVRGFLPFSPMCKSGASVLTARRASGYICPCFVL